MREIVALNKTSLSEYKLLWITHFIILILLMPQFFWTDSHHFNHVHNYIVQKLLSFFNFGYKLCKNIDVCVT